MAEQRNHISNEEIRRYLLNGMTGKERNAFERKLEGNPFAREAMDGLETVKAGELEEDLHEISERLTVDKKKSLRMVWYRVAASVILLIGISSVFYFVFLPKISHRTSDIAMQEKTPAD